ncbi:N-acetyl-1-D-myo-inositol-2-amino-2-deoxy-alpha-D-glucopyranoside deacetylase [Streptomyces tsukubensis]|uniref:1D-myo-inositol 2-acetamido-2-deoxy-alpha-D-glucopyranoside deacetylase n=1 Tax=Streptomyces tsukubensis TaxID=83656 RepID=A0A1V4ADH0_9ACTN|nr:N-acetyl-1-D-myo-inositol-2-amino-2-deoxy-alpha-D-glucopyranoside deacetylase [Streptomyces tsukubensis]OON81315.1 N-acetyl-1-D-myo-inositol-2-amino-2-deoxy-alpha-D-glucopyranoside deacetylase [Streptomyces tsukubensis]QFR95567.1 N-acetyl-1-D-myo-inositol-2-amino-2-deoxy-alpha-D-glucopyranoside deacetylase [Streptomyces tsukubensis]
MTELPGRRLLLVHAHPDDESINNGATMAAYAAGGAGVTLVTCTLGEEGEVIPPGLAHLAADRDDTLGPHRIGELAAAMRELGVTDHRFLGGAGRYRDSGMMGTAQNGRTGAFWNTPVEEAAAFLVEIVRETRPQVLVTYDPDGGYGHPDHIQAHRVAMRAAELAADPGYAPELGPAHTIEKIYWNRVPRSMAEDGFARIGESLPTTPFDAVAPLGEVPGVIEDSRITTEIDGRPHAAAKAAAMRAHATQITVSEPLFALSNGLAQPLFPVEAYELVRGRSGAADGEREADLFAGLAPPAGTGASAPVSHAEATGETERADETEATEAVDAVDARTPGAAGVTS